MRLSGTSRDGTEEKILIQLDTEPQNYTYQAERYILNKFDVFTTILTTPLPLLMAQKLFAILNRKRSKGRDFYDMVFLMSKNITPDYQYLSEKCDVSDADALKEKISEKCSSLDLEAMAKDVEPFLFNSQDLKKIRLFPDVFQQYVHL